MTLPTPGRRREPPRPCIVLEFAVLIHAKDEPGDLDNVKEFIQAVETAAPDGSLVQMRRAEWSR